MYVCVYMYVIINIHKSTGRTKIKWMVSLQAMGSKIFWLCEIEMLILLIHHSTLIFIGWSESLFTVLTYQWLISSENFCHTLVPISMMPINQIECIFQSKNQISLWLYFALTQKKRWQPSLLLLFSKSFICLLLSESGYLKLLLYDGC